MALHIVPEQEKEMHQESEDCPCGPVFKLDNESGEMVWIHNILDWSGVFDDFIKI